MGMVGTTRRFSYRSPANPLTELNPIAHKNEIGPPTAQVGLGDLALRPPAQPDERIPGDLRAGAEMVGLEIDLSAAVRPLRDLRFVATVVILDELLCPAF